MAQLALSDLPKAARRFADPKAPVAMRTMAAKALVPVRGTDLLLLLCLLCSDEDEAVKTQAHASLHRLPNDLLVGAARSLEVGAGVAQLARIIETEALHWAVVENPAVPDETLAFVAAKATEALCERIAANEVRLLQCPEIIAALYRNSATRMSTADRLVELAARNKVEVRGVPAFEAHAEALAGELIIEPTDEPLPSDLEFQETLQVGDDETEAVDLDPADGSESVKPKFKPLATRIAQMTKAEKIRLATVGNAAARSLLVRDPNRLVATAAVSSPRMTDREAAQMAKSKELSEEVLRYIGNKRDWVKSYSVKRSLVFNPKAPIGIALQFLGHMRLNDLVSLSRSRGVAAPVKAAAARQVAKRQKS